MNLKISKLKLKIILFYVLILIDFVGQNMRKYNIKFNINNYYSVNRFYIKN